MGSLSNVSGNFQSFNKFTILCLQIVITCQHFINISYFYVYRHVEKLQISNTCFKIIRVLNMLSINIKVLLYNTLIMPHLNCCLTVWVYESGKTKIIQKKVVRMRSLSKYNAHTDPLYKSLEILKLEDLLKIQELKLYYKYMHNKQLASKLIILYANIYIHDHFRTFSARHEFARKCTTHNMPRTINSAPLEIMQKINTHSIQGFIKLS